MVALPQVSIDTDLNYSDQGIMLNVDHAGSINSYFGALVQRFNDSIQKFGLRHYQRPSLLMQYPRAYYGFWSVWNAAPYGVSFPRIFGVR